jgi:hypothetical protein
MWSKTRRKKTKVRREFYISDIMIRVKDQEEQVHLELARESNYHAKSIVEKIPGKE